MSTTELVAELRKQNINLRADNGQLIWNGPKGALTPEMRAELLERKEEILTFLNNIASFSGNSVPPLQPVFRDRKPPLSFSQQRLWFLDQYEPNSSVYNIPGALRLRGSLDVGALEQSLNEILRRHESLRTTFSMVDGEPVQVIAPSLRLSLAVVDLRKHPQGEEEARGLVSEDARRPFDLTQGPLFRSKLLRLSEDDHVLLMTMHHIVSDGWSMGVLYRELSVLYRAFLNGQYSPLAELPIQYADYAVWQRQWLQGEVLDRQLSYWKKQLDGIPAILQLPTDRPRPAVQSYRGARQSFSLPKDLTDKLKGLSRKEGVTLFMTLLAAFQTLLYRYTAQDDIVVGSPIANRNRTEVEGLIGFFVNTLVLRSNFSDNPTFRELLARVREVALEAYAHQDLPFEKLVEDLQPERNVSHSPLFQVMFALQNASTANLSLEGLSLSPLMIGTETAKFDLTLSMSETASGLKGSLHYNTDLFDAATITRMLGHFRTLLEGIISDLDRPLADHPMLMETEKHQLLVEWNDTRRDYPKDKCIHQLFEEQVERRPGAVAVVFQGERLTYGELNRRANRLAHYLRTLGVGADVLVGIYMERSLEMVIAVLAVLKAGAAYVPLDPDYPSQRVSFVIEDSELVILLTQKRLVNKLPLHRARVVCVDGEPGFNAKVLRKNPTALAKPESLAYVIYTSGSTGSPKGVQVPHRTVVNLLESMRRELLLTDKDVMLSVTTISFDIAGLELYLPLTIGARVVLVSREVALDGKRLVASLEQVQATVMQATPSTWKLMLLSGWQGSRRLKILSGGEALSPELAEALHKVGGSVWNLYGPTETTIWSTAWRVKPGSGPISIGRPIANTQVYILDRNLQPVPIGVPGELHIGGDGVARGYLKRPELTAEKFIPDPLRPNPEARLYKTGDLARYLTDGDIEFLGRIDNQVKIRGFRIELGEIEAVLNQYPAIARAVVVDREISGDRRLVAYVMPKNRETPKDSDLKTFLQTKLPEYMVPAGFVMLEALPLTPNGKVDRKALPPADGIRSESGFVASRDSVELELAKIWGRILGIPFVGVKDNFFDLGGHSLLAVRLFAQIEKSFGRKLPLATLFQAPTIEQLAVLLREKEWFPSWSSLVAIQPNGSKPPFFCVHAHGGNVVIFKDLARRLGMDQPFYGLQARGLDGAEPRHTNIEEMARDYITEIRTLQPEGPYLIGGYCFGGKIAFEMAQQLRVQGQAVLLLALIDSYAPGHPKMLPWIRRRRVQIEFHCNNLAKAEPEERLAYFKKRGKNATAKMDAFAKKLLVKGCHGLRIRPPRALHSVAESNGRSRKGYHPTPYAGTIKVFSPTEGSSAYCHHVPDMGWKDFAVGGIDLYPIPGKFATIILEPRVEKLAEQLQSCIDAALRDERRRGSGKRYVEHLEHADPSLHPFAVRQGIRWRNGEKERCV